MSAPYDRRTAFLQLASVAWPLAMWFVEPPDGLAVQAWRLFAIFAAAIFSVVVNAFPILTASVLSVAAAVLTGLLPPAKAYAGFANGTILLIVIAFLVARGRLADVMVGWAPAAAALALIGAYVLLHYVFVSQTAHLLALFGVFMDVGVKLGVPAAPFAFQLLFATNYFAAIAPQGSSANLLFAGSGFLSQRDLYRLGGVATAFNLLVYLVIGTPWLMFEAGAGE
jgi:di/tricarboxylate transporter